MFSGSHRRARLRSTLIYSMRLVVTVLIAMFSFCPVGAYLPRRRRNPAAKIGLPTMVVKDKAGSFEKSIERRDLVEN